MWSLYALRLTRELADRRVRSCQLNIWILEPLYKEVIYCSLWVQKFVKFCLQVCQSFLFFDWKRRLWLDSQGRVRYTQETGSRNQIMCPWEDLVNRIFVWMEFWLNGILFVWHEFTKDLFILWNGKTQTSLCIRLNWFERFLF